MSQGFLRKVIECPLCWSRQFFQKKTRDISTEHQPTILGLNQYMFGIKAALTFQLLVCAYAKISHK
jgi:hypothetical protein